MTKHVSPPASRIIYAEKTQVRHRQVVLHKQASRKKVCFTVHARNMSTCVLHGTTGNHDTVVQASALIVIQALSYTLSALLMGPEASTRCHKSGDTMQGGRTLIPISYSAVAQETVGPQS